VDVSERIRALVKDPALTVAPRAEALLYAAARAQLVHERSVRCSRRASLSCSTGSWTPRWPTRAPGASWGWRRCGRSTEFATGGLTPDRTLLLRIDPALGRARQRERALEPDRLERENERFFATIAAAYDDLAREEPERIRPIDGVQAQGDVLRDALTAIEDLLVTRADD
jgi:dTMP kinase